MNGIYLLPRLVLEFQNRLELIRRLIGLMLLIAALHVPQQATRPACLHWNLTTRAIYDADPIVAYITHPRPTCLIVPEALQDIIQLYRGPF